MLIGWPFSLNEITICFVISWKFAFYVFSFLVWHFLLSFVLFRLLESTKRGQADMHKLGGTLHDFNKIRPSFCCKAAPQYTLFYTPTLVTPKALFPGSVFLSTRLMFQCNFKVTRYFWTKRLWNFSKKASQQIFWLKNNISKHWSFILATL